MTEYEVATLIARSIALVIGIGQLAVVWYGIHIMNIDGERRAREQDRRHDATMAALRARRDEMMEAHDEAMTTLTTLRAPVAHSNEGDPVMKYSRSNRPQSHG